MNRKKALLFLITGLLAVGSMVGCGDDKVEESEASAEASDIELEEESLNDKVVTDHLGREVEIPENLDKVLALTSNAMESLFEIGVKPIGRTEEYKIREEAENLPSIGKGSQINIEAIHALSPDLIIANTRQHGNLVSELEETGAQVYFFDPSETGENPLVDTKIFLGKLLGKDEEANGYEAGIYEISEALKEKVKSETEIETGIILRDGENAQAAQSGTGYGAILSMLGIENIVPEGLTGSDSSNYVDMSIESIIEQDPDIILIIAPTNDKENNKAVLQKYKTDPKYANLTAVKEGRIAVLPFKVNANRASSAEMLEISAKTIIEAGK